MTNKEGKEALTAERVLFNIRLEHDQFKGTEGEYTIDDFEDWKENNPPLIKVILSAMESYALLKVAEKDKEIEQHKEAISTLAKLYRELKGEVAESRKANAELKKIRDYFAENDRTPFEHHAFEVLDKILKGGEIVPPEKEWISVKDRLPEQSITCTVVKVFDGVVFDPYTAHFKTNSGNFYSMGEIVFPTHWQSLPDTSKLK